MIYVAHPLAGDVAGNCDPPPGWARIELFHEEGQVKHTGKRAWRDAMR